MEIHEYLVLKYSGKVEHFPVVDGDVAQAMVRATLCQLPGDCLVVVTDDAYIRLRTQVPAEKPTRAAPGRLSCPVIETHRAAVNASPPAIPLLVLKGGAASADLTHMAAAHGSGITASELLDAISPELVLVDSDLAMRARVLLPDPGDTLTLPASTLADPDATLTLPASVLPEDDDTPALQAKSGKPRVFPVSFPDNGSFLDVVPEDVGSSGSSFGLSRLAALSLQGDPG